MANFFTQAYKQAPWRQEKRLSSAILLAIMVGTLVALLYLFVINQKAAAGISIQTLESERRQAVRSIADLRTQLAFITSASQMRARAKELGFVQMDPENALYIVVNGYHGRQVSIPVEIQPQNTALRPSFKSSYHTSLWDWLIQKFEALPEVSK